MNCYTTLCIAEPADARLKLYRRRLLQLTSLRARVAARVSGVRPRLFTAFRLGCAPRLISKSNITYRLPYCKMYSVSQKIHPTAGFLAFFHKRLKVLNHFTHILDVPIYTRLQIFIQLSPTFTKLCHIKRDYLVHTICAKCPPSAETHAFRRLRKLLMALLIVVCGKACQICWFCNVNKRWRHLLSKQT